MSSFAALAGMASLYFHLFFGWTQAVCPPDWVTWQDSCYILLPGKMTWFDAKMVCDRPGSSMIVPNSQAEHDFIWQEFGNSKDVDIWIGCRDFVNPETLVCLDSKHNAQFENWNAGEPNEDHECARMEGIFDGKWESFDCSSEKFAACEMQVPHPVYCLTADSAGRFTPQCLLNHDIKNMTAKGVFGCGQACWAEPRCHSFNLLQQGKICQLNNASRHEADVLDFMITEDCSLFDV